MQTDEPSGVVPRTHTYPAGCAFKSPADLAGKRITVMGLGLNGGGEAAVRFLLAHGAVVTATDMKGEAELAPTLSRLRADSSLDLSRLTLHLGGHDMADFSGTDCVIKNPGVKYDGNAYLAAARVIETDLSLFLAFSRAPVIAVTGSKGKSSTVSAIHWGLTRAGFTAFLGGNITVSPLTFLEQTDETTPVVLELSSWQLADLRGRRLLKPKIAIITKIIPDHQNFYHSMLAYVADKKLIYADQTRKDYAIFDFDDDPAADGGTLIENWGDVFAREARATVLRYSRKPLPKGTDGAYFSKGGAGKIRLGGTDEAVLGDLITPGTHIRTNALNAALVLRIMGVGAERIKQILSEWKGIEHRLEFFHEWRGIKFYNDSAATVPEAAALASQSFTFPVVLITGGTDKGLDLSPLADALCAPGAKRPLAIYLLSGTATDKLRALFAARGIEARGEYGSLRDLLTALRHDLEAAGAGAPGADAAAPEKSADSLRDTRAVVFSPGATSFGMFKNEFDRGNQFKKSTKEIFA